MTDRSIEHSLRRFMLAIAAGICVGTVLELLLIGHRENWVQWIPFVLSLIGLATIVPVYRSPSAKKIKALRFAMYALIIGSIVGVYKHVAENAAFAREIQPNAAVIDIVEKAVTGASPLMAPGILALAAALALGAIYRHPAAIRPGSGAVG